MDDTFLMATTSSITMQSLGKIVQRTAAVGAKMWCLFFCSFFCYRQDAAKRQTAGIVFTHRPKIRFFAPQGRLVAPIQVKLCRTDATWVRLAVQNFTSIGADGWECGPQNIKKIPLFGKESPRRGDSLDPFPQFLGAFIRPTILR